MIEINHNDKNRFEYLQLSCGTIVDGVLWGAASDFNGLLKVDLAESCSEFVCALDNESDFNQEMYSQCLEVDRKLFFIPGRANRIAVYNIKTAQLTHIDILDLGEEVGSKFSYAASNGSKIFIFPRCLNSLYIYKIDTEKNTIARVCEGYTEKNNSLIWPDKYLPGCVSENKVYIASGISNVIFEFDMIEECIEMVIQIDASIPAIRYVKKSGENIYILGYDSSLIELELDTGKTRILYKGDENGCEYSYFEISGSVIIMIPNENDEFIFIDIKRNEREIIRCNKRKKAWKRWECVRSPFWNYVWNKKDCYILNNALDSIAKVDFIEKKIIYKKIELEEMISQEQEHLLIEKKKRDYRAKYLTQGILMENDDISLEMYIFMNS